MGKQALLVIGASVVGFILINNIFISPLRKSNKKLAKEYKEWKEKVKQEGRGEASPSRLSFLEGKLKEYSPKVESMFLRKDESLLKTISLDAWKREITFTDISSKPSSRQENIIKEEADCRIKAEVSSLFRFLLWLEEQEKFISINELSITRQKAGRSAGRGAAIEASIAFSAYRPAEVSSEPVSLASRDIDKIFSLPSRIPEELDFSRLQSINPFTVDLGLRVTPEPIERGSVSFNEEDFSLKGVTVVGDERMALINDRLFKEGDEIDGFTIMKIEQRKVKLSRENAYFFIEIK